MGTKPLLKKLVGEMPLSITLLYGRKDSNGTLLAEGDSVTLIKDLKVKGSSLTLKRGTVVKNTRLTNSAAEIEGRAGGSTMVLKTEFLEKI